MRINDNKNEVLLRFGIICAAVLVCSYILFLILPFIISPFAQKYSSQIENMIKNTTGLEADIQGLGIITTPKLGIGFKFKNFSINIPGSETKILYIQNGKSDLRLLPLIIKKVELGNITADTISSSIRITQNGEFEIQKYLELNRDNSSQALASLPYGLKLSNNLPDIKIKHYKLSFIENNQKLYYISGNNLKIRDFIFNKKIKVSSNGKIVFNNRVISNYDINIFNKIMPDTQFDDFIFPQKVTTDNSSSKTPINISFNIADILNSIDKTGLKADLYADIKTSGTLKNPAQNGRFEVTGLSVKTGNRMLPEGYAKLLFKGKKTKIDSTLYTSSDTKEKTQINGYIKTGRRPSIDMAVKSNAEFENIIRLIDSLAQSFGMDDLKTLSATGGINADFKIKSNMKKIRSDGSLKILTSSIKFGAYNVLIDKISADIDLNNNNINIKNAGFSILGHSLKLFGTISSKAVADLKLTADKLSLKGLIASLGQMNLLKGNNINSGTVSLNAVVKGKMTEIKPDITLNANNLNIYNKSSNVRLLLNNALIKLILDKNSPNGNIIISSLKLKNPAASVSIPKMNIKADTKNITIDKSYVLINNSRIDVHGKVTNYLTNKLNMDITANGNLASSDVAAFIPENIRTMVIYKGSMPLSIKAAGNSKTQDVTFNLKATPSGFVRFLDINALKNKTTQIRSDMKISNGDIDFENSGIYSESAHIADLTGKINNLTHPELDLKISVPKNISFPIPGIGGKSNVTTNGNVNITGGLTDYKIKGKVKAKDISIKNMDFTLTNLTANLNGTGINGHGTADKIRMGNITGTNLSAKFNLNNDFTTFNLVDIVSDAFDGKVNGKLTYDIPNFAFGVDLTGKGLNSTDAVYAVSGIQKALTGTLGFNAKLTGKGVTDIQIIKSLKGNADFKIDDGRFVSIGKFENFVKAQNIESISILKSIISSLSTASALQQTDKFKSITGDFTMSQGEANFSDIKVSGSLMSYYVKGYYNLLTNNANFNILGRIDSKIVSLLGPFGQLTATKLLSYIPKFGANTAAMLNKLTQNPNSENIKLIPELSSGSKSYKDFKVVFIGNIYKSSSIRSFRWLSSCDTTQMNVKQDVKQAVQAAKDNVKNQVTVTKNTVKNVKTNVNNIVNTQKQKVQTEKQAVEQTKQEVKNLKQNAGKSAVNLGKLLKNAASKANQQAAPSKTETPTQTQTTEAETSSPKAAE